MADPQSVGPQGLVVQGGDGPVERPHPDAQALARDEFGGRLLRRDGAELMLQKIRADVGESRSAARSGGGWDAYIRVPDVRSLREAVRGARARSRAGRGERVRAARSSR